MQAAEIDQAYTYLCQTMTRLGQAQSEFFLARLALLAIQDMPDAASAMRWVDAAAQDVPAAERPT